MSVEGEAGKPSIEFTPDGELRAAELKIMNLRPALGEQVCSALTFGHSTLFYLSIYPARKFKPIAQNT